MDFLVGGIVVAAFFALIIAIIIRRRRRPEEMPSVEVRNWERARYILRFQITPATPKTSQVGVYAKFEGMLNGPTGTEWIALTSKGELEDLMLRCIQDR